MRRLGAIQCIAILLFDSGFAAVAVGLGWWEVTNARTSQPSRQQTKFVTTPAQRIVCDPLHLRARAPSSTVSNEDICRPSTCLTQLAATYARICRILVGRTPTTQYYWVLLQIALCYQTTCQLPTCTTHIAPTPLHLAPTRRILAIRTMHHYNV